jgi:hypothetical protein
MSLLRSKHMCFVWNLVASPGNCRSFRSSSRFITEFSNDSATTLQQLSNSSATTLQQLCNNSATTLQKLCNNSATNQQAYCNKIALLPERIWDASATNLHVFGLNMVTEHPKIKKSFRAPVRALRWTFRMSHIWFVMKPFAYIETLSR